ncbi:hypothetical protein EGW08_014884 [Elysia chlorotica]|uniref:Uncharacterized protein n=1 Tax=Elysia chlorotica TaxID=188477 RepID=A0A433T744_ELYCH|nr:hypothetical protein EGW08_014884 [Elysia chlorotica]
MARVQARVSQDKPDRIHYKGFYLELGHRLPVMPRLNPGTLAPSGDDWLHSSTRADDGQSQQAADHNDQLPSDSHTGQTARNLCEPPGPSNPSARSTICLVSSLTPFLTSTSSSAQQIRTLAHLPREFLGCSQSSGLGQPALIPTARPDKHQALRRSPIKTSTFPLPTPPPAHPALRDQQAEDAEDSGRAGLQVEETQVAPGRPSTNSARGYSIRPGEENPEPRTPNRLS